MCTFPGTYTSIFLNHSWYILILDRAWITSLINNAFETKVILYNDDEVDNDHNISTEKPTYEHYRGPLGLIIIDCIKATLKDFTHLAYNCICLTLNRYFKSQFSDITFPIELLYQNRISIYKGTEYHWFDQVLCRNDYFFGNVYGMEIFPLLTFDIST